MAFFIGDRRLSGRLEAHRHAAKRRAVVRIDDGAANRAGGCRLRERRRGRQDDDQADVSETGESSYRPQRRFSIESRLAPA